MSQVDLKTDLDELVIQQKKKKKHAPTKALLFCCCMIFWVKGEVVLRQKLN